MDSSKLIIALCMGLALSSCSDDDSGDGSTGTALKEADFIGKDVGNFTAEEWFTGGQKGTTMNVTQGCYEDQTPAVTEMGLTDAFNRGARLICDTDKSLKSASVGQKIINDKDMIVL